MEIRYFDRLDSTQTYLIEAIQNKTLSPPIAIRCALQTRGIGSRNNSWEGEEGNFFASFALKRDTLPHDLPLVSVSIYFSFLMCKVLRKMGCDVWLKWPNDIYQGDWKVGGTVSKLVGDVLVWGIGINLVKGPKNFHPLDCPCSADILFNIYIQSLQRLPKWKDLFREYEIEFTRNKGFDVHVGKETYSLQEATLLPDGSIMIEGKQIVSGR